MRAVVQRVLESWVEVDGERVGGIGRGLLVFLGVSVDDGPRDLQFLAEKIVHLRVFPDSDDKMNRSVLDIQGGILVVSQFTLLGDCRKGRRPSYVAAAPPPQAQALYEGLLEALSRHPVEVASGRFQENMRVHLINDGPVTLLLDSKRNF